MEHLASDTPEDLLLSYQKSAISEILIIFGSVQTLYDKKYTFIYLNKIRPPYLHVKSRAQLVI